MKKIIILALILTCGKVALAQENFGKTLNIGVGAGYYRYVIGPTPAVLTVNYEFQLANNFTLAPFVSFYSYRSRWYYANPPGPAGPRYYYYRETVVPLGAKGSYYFDDLFNLHSDWDIYAAASLGVAFRSVSWDSDYYGDRYAYRAGYGPGPLYADIHIGAEYHINQTVGLFVDLSSGVSTFGVAIH